VSIFFRNWSGHRPAFFICGACMHYPEIPGGRLAHLIYHFAVSL
jgi:hypothetical protein